MLHRAMEHREMLGCPEITQGVCHPGSLRASSWRTGRQCLDQKGRCTGTEEGISNSRGITGKSLMLLDRDQRQVVRVKKWSEASSK